MNPAAIAIAASVGKAALRVYHKPVVAIVATGDELVEVCETPGAAQIRNSNSYSIAAQVHRAGGEPLILPIARDREDSIRAALHEAKSAELLILSGGVSMGKYDLVENVLVVGRRAVSHDRRAHPAGKAGCFRYASRAKGMVCRSLDCPAIRSRRWSPLTSSSRRCSAALAGATSFPLRFAHARLDEDFKVAPGLTRFLPAILSGTSSDSRLAVVPWHGSGDLAAIVRANCYLVVPPEASELARDAYVSVLLKD